MLVTVLLGLLALAAVALLLALPAAEGSPEPPPSGDWNIGAGETVSHSDRTFDLRGDLNVRGSLTLVDCTLWVWSSSGAPNSVDVSPSGSLTLVRTEVGAGDPLAPYVMRAQAGSILSVTGSTFYRAGVGTASDGRDSGFHIATDGSISTSVFDHCFIGLWLQADGVTVDDCDFFDCEVGIAVVESTQVSVDACDFVRCGIAVVCDTSELDLEALTSVACGEGLIAFSSQITATGCTVAAFERIGMGFYGGQASVANSTFQDGEGDALVVSGGKGYLTDLRFSDCVNDMRVVSSEVWVTNTSHLRTEDAALLAHRSIVHVDGMSTVDSYWGLRGRWATGEVRDLRTINATFSIEVVLCDGLRIDRLSVEGNATGQTNQNARGIYAVESTLDVRDSTMYNTRNGMYLDSVSGLVENVTVRRCTREGVIVRQCTGLLLRRVNVTAATDGFLFTIYSASRLEDCLSLANRDVGFNFTSGARDTLVRCNASGCGMGASVYIASPRLVGCALYQCDALGRPIDMSFGFRSEEGAPVLEHSVVTGAEYGVYLTASSARLTNVTFVDIDAHCVSILGSSGDVVERCTITGVLGCSGVVIVAARSPVLRDNHIFNLTYGVSIYNGSIVSLIGNTIEDIDWDGVTVLLDCIVTLEGNTIRDCRSNSLQVGYNSQATVRGDTYEGVGVETVCVLLGSTLDMDGCTITRSSIGVNGIDAPRVHVLHTDFRDNNQGIRVGIGEMSERVDLTVEGCYFYNHSSYSVGASDTDVTVRGCTFLDNIGGIQVWNATSPVRIEDCTLVGSWLFGVQVDGGTVDWQVRGSCRVLSSDIEAAVDMTVHPGARLEMEEAKVTLGGTARHWSMTDATVSLRRVAFKAPGGCPFRVVGGSLELVNSTFEGIGPAWNSDPLDLGISMEGSNLVARDTLILRSRAGLSFDGVEAELVNVTVSECMEHGVLAYNSEIMMSACVVERIAQGPSLRLVDCDLKAEGTTLSLSKSGLVMGRGTAMLWNCSIGGMAASCVNLTDGDAVLVNTTHVEGQVHVGGGGRLEAWWYVSARVVWANLSELPEVEVTIEDGTQRLVASMSPDPAGRVAAVAVLAYEATSSGATPWGPHQVIARLHGFEVKVRLELVASVDVELRLLDETPPVITVASPSAAESWQTSNVLAVHGQAVDAGSGTRTVEARLDYDKTYTSEGTGFLFELHTFSGRHVVILKATDWAGNSINTTLVIWVETTPLGLALTKPIDVTSTNADSIEIVGIVTRPGTTVRVNSALANVTANRFTIRYGLVEGLNSLKVEATDVYGHRAVQNLTVWVDRKPPELVVTSPLSVNTSMRWVTVEGRAGPDANVTINNVPVLMRGGAFDVRYPVGVGESFVVVRATDGVGNEAVVRILVDREMEDEPVDEPNTWEVVPFVVLIPLLMAVVWYAIERPDRWGDRK